MVVCCMLAFCLPYFSILKMEAAYFREKSLDLQRTTGHYIPDDRTLQKDSWLKD
jgi:hypothetical protein